MPASEQQPNRPTLVDTHAHLHDSAYASDRAAVVARAVAAGVTRLVCVGTDLPSCRQTLEVSELHAGVFAALGVHPHEASQLDAEALAELRTLAGQPKVVAIGEIGLDYYRDRSPQGDQREAFHAQLALAGELGLPVIVHDREAHAEVMATLRQWVQDYPGARGVLHCFSGDEAMARAAIALGFCISFAGPLTYPNAARLPQLAASLPLEWLLVETDCPYLTPAPLRGQRNEPANLALVAERLAALRGLTLAEVAEATTANAIRLFGLV